MSVKTFRGQLPIGVQEKIHLSTNDGLTGYRINKFQIMSSTPGDGEVEYVAKIYLTDQTGKITATVNLSEPDLIGVVYHEDQPATAYTSSSAIIMDKETFNQDIFVYITDTLGGTIAGNFYLELEQVKLDLNASTYITVKNIRSRTQV